MAFRNHLNELNGIVVLMLFGIPLIASTLIDCGGRPFLCVNSTHFRICVDLGGGVSSTVDDFIIPCPPTTICEETNRYECEFPTLPTSAPILRTSDVTNEISATTLPWEEIRVSTVFPPNNVTRIKHSDLKKFNTVSLTTASGRASDIATVAVNGLELINEEVSNGTIINTTEMALITLGPAIKDNVTISESAAILLNVTKALPETNVKNTKNESINSASEKLETQIKPSYKGNDTITTNVVTNEITTTEIIITNTNNIINSQVELMLQNTYNETKNKTENEPVLISHSENVNFTTVSALLPDVFVVTKHINFTREPINLSELHNQTIKAVTEKVILLQISTSEIKITNATADTNLMIPTNSSGISFSSTEIQTPATSVTNTPFIKISSTESPLLINTITPQAASLDLLKHDTPLSVPNSETKSTIVSSLDSITYKSPKATTMQFVDIPPKQDGISAATDISMSGDISKSDKLTLYGQSTETFHNVRVLETTTTQAELSKNSIYMTETLKSDNNKILNIGFTDIVINESSNNNVSLPVSEAKNITSTDFVINEHLDYSMNTTVNKTIHNQGESTSRLNDTLMTNLKIRPENILIKDTKAQSENLFSPNIILINETTPDVINELIINKTLIIKAKQVSVLESNMPVTEKLFIMTTAFISNKSENISISKLGMDTTTESEKLLLNKNGTSMGEITTPALAYNTTIQSNASSYSSNVPRKPSTTDKGSSQVTVQPLLGNDTIFLLENSVVSPTSSSNSSTQAEILSLKENGITVSGMPMTTNKIYGSSSTTPLNSVSNVNISGYVSLHTMTTHANEIYLPENGTVSVENSFVSSTGSVNAGNINGPFNQVVNETTETQVENLSMQQNGTTVTVMGITTDVSYVHDNTMPLHSSSNTLNGTENVSPNLSVTETPMTKGIEVSLSENDVFLPENSFLTSTVSGKNGFTSNPISPIVKGATTTKVENINIKNDSIVTGLGTTTNYSSIKILLNSSSNIVTTQSTTNTTNLPVTETVTAQSTEWSLSESGIYLGENSFNSSTGPINLFVDGTITTENLNLNHNGTTTIIATITDDSNAVSNITKDYENIYLATPVTETATAQVTEIHLPENSFVPSMALENNGFTSNPISPTVQGRTATKLENLNIQNGSTVTGVEKTTNYSTTIKLLNSSSNVTAQSVSNTTNLPTTKTVTAQSTEISLSESGLSLGENSFNSSTGSGTAGFINSSINLSVNGTITTGNLSLNQNGTTTVIATITDYSNAGSNTTKDSENVYLAPPVTETATAQVTEIHLPENSFVPSTALENNGFTSNPISPTVQGMTATKLENLNIQNDSTVSGVRTATNYNTTNLPVTETVTAQSTERRLSENGIYLGENSFISSTGSGNAGFVNSSINLRVNGTLITTTENFSLKQNGTTTIIATITDESNTTKVIENVATPVSEIAIAQVTEIYLPKNGISLLEHPFISSTNSGNSRFDNSPISLLLTETTTNPLENLSLKQNARTVSGMTTDGYYRHTTKIPMEASLNMAIHSDNVASPDTEIATVQVTELHLPEYGVFVAENSFVPFRGFENNGLVNSFVNSSVKGTTESQVEHSNLKQNDTTVTGVGSIRSLLYDTIIIPLNSPSNIKSETESIPINLVLTETVTTRPSEMYLSENGTSFADNLLASTDSVIPGFTNSPISSIMRATTAPQVEHLNPEQNDTTVAGIATIIDALYGNSTRIPFNNFSNTVINKTTVSDNHAKQTEITLPSKIVSSEHAQSLTEITDVIPKDSIINGVLIAPLLMDIMKTKFTEVNSTQTAVLVTEKTATATDSVIIKYPIRPIFLSKELTANQSELERNKTLSTDAETASDKLHAENKAIPQSDINASSNIPINTPIVKTSIQVTELSFPDSSISVTEPPTLYNTTEKQEQVFTNVSLDPLVEKLQPNGSTMAKNRISTTETLIPHVVTESETASMTITTPFNNATAILPKSNSNIIETTIQVGNSYLIPSQSGIATHKTSDIGSIFSSKNLSPPSFLSPVPQTNEFSSSNSSVSKKRYINEGISPQNDTYIYVESPIPFDDPVDNTSSNTTATHLNSNKGITTLVKDAVTEIVGTVLNTTSPTLVLENLSSTTLKTSTSNKPTLTGETMSTTSLNASISKPNAPKVIYTTFELGQIHRTVSINNSNAVSESTTNLPSTIEEIVSVHSSASSGGYINTFSTSYSTQQLSNMEKPTEYTTQTAQQSVKSKLSQETANPSSTLTTEYSNVNPTNNLIASIFKDHQVTTANPNLSNQPLFTYLGDPVNALKQNPLIHHILNSTTQINITSVKIDKSSTIPVETNSVGQPTTESVVTMKLFTRNPSASVTVPIINLPGDNININNNITLKNQDKFLIPAKPIKNTGSSIDHMESITNPSQIMDNLRTKSTSVIIDTATFGIHILDKNNSQSSYQSRNSDTSTDSNSSSNISIREVVALSSQFTSNSGAERPRPTYPKASSHSSSTVKVAKDSVTTRRSRVDGNLSANNNKKMHTESHSYCLIRSRGRYADKHDCRKFYICIGRPQPIVGLCPVNTVFSEIKTQCTKNLSHCVRENQFRCSSEGRFSDYLRENVYYICVKNKQESFVRFKFQCQKGYHLNKTSVRCLLHPEPLSMSIIDNTSVSTVEKKSSEDTKSVNKDDSKDDKEEFKCKDEGKFAVPNDCHKYFVCTKNRHSEYHLRIKKCHKDEMFHKDKKKCVDAESSEC